MAIVTRPPKKCSRASELISNKGRCAIRIVTFCPPALAIRLNGPGTANPPPPRWPFRALFYLGHRHSSRSCARSFPRCPPVSDANGEDRELVQAVERDEQQQHRDDVWRGQHGRDGRRSDDRVAARF